MTADIEYDPDKSEWTRQERGFDFEYAAKIFDGFVIEWNSTRGREPRIGATGMIDGRYYTVIYTWRGSRRRIISARIARKGERNEYRQKEP